MTGYFYVPYEPPTPVPEQPPRSTVDSPHAPVLPGWVEPPAAGECHVWWADAVPVRLGWLAVLAEDERARLAAYRLLADRDAFGTAAIALRTALAGYLRQEPAEITVDWRAATAAGRYAISVAHSGRRVGVAISRAGRVGLGLQWLAAAPGTGAAAADRQAIHRAGGKPRLYALHPAAGYAGALAVHASERADICEYLFRPTAPGRTTEHAA